MNTRNLLAFGIAGTLIIAIGCFTPALVLLLAGVGLADWMTWLDSLLFPLLVVFIAITAFALAARRSAKRGGVSGAEPFE